MNKADLVANYFSRLTQKHYGRPVYIKEKGKDRDEIMQGIASMCALVGIDYKILSPARICRTQLSFPKAPKLKIQDDIVDAFRNAFNQSMSPIVTGRNTGKSAAIEQMMKEALISGRSIVSINKDGIQTVIDP